MSCSGKEKNQTLVHLCENTSPQRSLQQRVPVFRGEDGAVFANVFCAKCNSDRVYPGPELEADNAHQSEQPEERSPGSQGAYMIQELRFIGDTQSVFKNDEFHESKEVDDNAWPAAFDERDNPKDSQSGLKTIPISADCINILDSQTMEEVVSNAINRCSILYGIPETSLATDRLFCQPYFSGLCMPVSDHKFQALDFIKDVCFETRKMFQDVDWSFFTYHAPADVCRNAAMEPVEFCQELYDPKSDGLQNLNIVVDVYGAFNNRFLKTSE